MNPFRLLLWVWVVLTPQAVFLGIWGFHTYAAASDRALLLRVATVVRGVMANDGGVHSVAWALGIFGILLPFFMRRSAWIPRLCVRPIVAFGLVAVGLAGSLRAFLAAGHGAFPIYSALVPALAAGLLASAAMSHRQRTDWMSGLDWRPVLKANVPMLVAFAVLAILLHGPKAMQLHALVYDEAFTMLNYVNTGPVIAIWRYDFPNNHIAFSVLSGFLSPTASAGIPMIRLVAFAFYVALGIVCAITAYRLGGPVAQAVTSALILTHPFLVLFATTGRGYTMAMFLAAAGTILLMSDDNRLRRIGRLGVLVSVWVIPPWIALAMVVAAWDIGYRRNSEALREWVAILLAAAVWYVPAGIFAAATWRSIHLSGLVGGVGKGLRGILFALEYATGHTTKGLGPIFLTTGVLLLLAGLARRPAAIRQPLTVLAACLVASAIGVPTIGGGPLTRMVSMFVPTYAIIAGLGASNVVRGLGTLLRTKSLRIWPALGGTLVVALVALPLLSGAVQLGANESVDDNVSRQQMSDFLSSRLHADDLLLMRAWDSAQIIALLEPEQPYRAMDAVFVRFAWEQSQGNIWAVIHKRTYDLDYLLSVVENAESIPDAFLAPSVALETDGHILYLFERRAKPPHEL